MKDYTWLKTTGEPNHIDKQREHQVDVWIHDGRIFRNRTSWSDQELKHITNNFRFMDDINCELFDSYGCPIEKKSEPKNDNKYMYILIAR